MNSSVNFSYCAVKCLFENGSKQVKLISLLCCLTAGIYRKKTNDTYKIVLCSLALTKI